MRRRILLLVTGITVLVVLAFAIPLAILIRHNVYADATRSLQSETGAIAFFLSGYDRTPTRSEIAKYLRDRDGNRAASVQLPDGTVVGKQPPGGVRALPALTRDRGGPGGLGYPGTSGSVGSPSGSGDGGGRGGPPTQLHHVAGGEAAQLQTYSNQGLSVVRVYASDAELHSGERGWFLLLAGASLGLLLVGAVAGELLTRRIVAPLVETSDTAQRLAAGDVTARAPTSGPSEVADVGRALNRLADRIDQLIAEERETVADLSHRLRTPLTALRLDAEALRDREDAERIGTHVSALERMLTAVIRAARRPQREGRMPACDASEVVRDRVAFWSALAEDQGRVDKSEITAQALPVRAAAEDLAAAVDALVENVIAHTPEGTGFAVRLDARDGGARLTVSDEGPGMADHEPVRGRSDRGSSGLGLDIARRCAVSSGGAMTIGTNSAGGATVTLDLGAP